MDQSVCASLSHTHEWYEEGMLKVSYDGAKVTRRKEREEKGSSFWVRMKEPAPLK